MKPTFPLRYGDLDLVGPRERCEERLSLRDLWHLRA